MRTYHQLVGLTLITLSALCLGQVAQAAASAVNASYSLNEDTSKTVPLRGGCSGTETKSLSVGRPSHGTTTLSGTNAIYTPTSNYNGTDQFTYTVTCTRNGSSNSATGTISLTIASVNDLPTATTTTTFTTTEDTTLTGQVTGSDVDNNPLTFSASGSTGGSISMDTTGRFTYTPSTNFNGTGSFTYRVWDGYAYSTNAAVTVNVSAVNDAPVVQALSRTISEDSSLTATINATDVDSSNLSYAVVSAPMFGSANFSSNVLTYTPNQNYNGADSFSIVASDGSATSVAAAVTVTINPVNDTPTASSLTVTTDSRTPIDITLAGADVDNDTLTYSVPINPLFGSVGGLVGNQLTYTPRDQFVGTDTFNYAVSDGTRTTSATVTVNVTAIPQAVEITAAVVQGETIEIHPIGSNSDGGTVTYTLTAEPHHGTLAISDGRWFYTAPADYIGIDTFMYTSNTSTTTSDPQLIRVNITAPTGLPGTHIVQMGMNFLNLSDASVLSTLQDLGVQAVRQVGDGDTTWSQVELSEGRYRDPSAIAEIRSQYHAAGIQVIDTLFKTMFASCTDPANNEQDPTQLVETLDANCIDYIEHVDDYIAAITPAGETIYFEAGNELFHWVTNPNYTPTEQAAVSGYAIDSVLSALRARGYTAYSITPSIMIHSEMTWDWWDEFMTALNTDAISSSSADLPYINYHYYDDDSTYRSARQHFEDEDRWVDDKLMILTEFGFSDLPEYTRTENNTPQTKAERFIKLAIMAWGAGDTAVFVHPYYYGVSDSDFPGMGLIREDGSYTPEAFAYRYVHEQLVPFIQVADLSDDNSEQYIYQFMTEAGDTKYVVWGTGVYTIPTGINSSTMMYSETGSFSSSLVTAGSQLTLSDTPVLLQ
jgi:VCBS repeat-containing protein